MKKVVVLFFLLSAITDFSYCQDNNSWVLKGVKFSYPYNPSGCGEDEFRQENRRSFIFIGSIDWYNDTPLLIEPQYSYDSVVVEERYVNCMGFIRSETEGISSYDTTKVDLPLSELFYYAPWNRLEKDKANQYSFAHYHYDKNYWKPRKPSVSMRKYNEWFLQKCEEWEIDPKEEEWRKKVESYMRQIRVKVYVNGVSHQVTLKLFHRNGEC